MEGETNRKGKGQCGKVRGGRKRVQWTDGGMETKGVGRQVGREGGQGGKGNRDKE